MNFAEFNKLVNHDKTQKKYGYQLYFIAGNVDTFPVIVMESIFCDPKVILLLQLGMNLFLGLLPGYIREYRK